MTARAPQDQKSIKPMKPRELARFLGIHETTARRIAKQQGVKIGGTWFVDVARLFDKSKVSS